MIENSAYFGAKSLLSFTFSYGTNCLKTAKHSKVDFYLFDN